MSDNNKTTSSGIIFNELGNTGLKNSGGLIYEEFLPRLQWPRAGAIYHEMSSNDPVVTSILMASRQLVRKVEWSVEPASQKRADVKAAQFLEECMNDMSHTWSAFIDDLMSFFEYGWSYMEIVYKKRNGCNCGKAGCSSKYDDNRIGWRKITGRAQTTLQGWEIDDYGSIRGMYQYTDNGVVYIPIEKALLFRTTTARNNPEGKSFLRGAYRPWYFKKHIEEVEGIGIERDLAGLPVLTAPAGLDLLDQNNPKAVQTKNDALKLVSSIRRDRNEGIVLSDGWKIQLLNAGGSHMDTSEVINRYDQRIAITMLSDIVMMGGDKVGSFALAKTKESLLAAALDAQLANVVDILNEIAVPRLFALNTFTGLSGFPKFKVTSVITPNLTDLGNFIKALSGAKMPLFPDLDLENYLRRMVNFPEVNKDDEERQTQLEAASLVTKKSTDPAVNNDPDDPKDPNLGNDKDKQKKLDKKNVKTEEEENA
jgi:hypothetical protein